MTNKDLFRIAMEQSAIDSACAPEDFTRHEGVAVISKSDPRARRYLTLPFDLDLTSYGSNVVASCSESLLAVAKAYIDRFPACHCFETPNLHVLMDALRPMGLDVCFMAEYWLPDLEILRALPCPYETKILHPEDFESLYLPEWSNALCEKRKHLDMLAVGAYDGEKLIGLAGCSADSDTMWQIGIDVLPEYRRQGVASSLTSILALEALHRGMVPFYCCAWSNVASARNAIRAGFRPAWVTVTVKSKDFIREMNG